MVTCNIDSTSVSIFFLASLSVKLVAPPAKWLSKAASRICQADSGSHLPILPSGFSDHESLALNTYPRNWNRSLTRKQRKTLWGQEFKKDLWEQPQADDKLNVFKNYISFNLYKTFCDICNYSYITDEELKHFFHDINKLSTMFILLDSLEIISLSYSAWLVLKMSYTEWLNWHMFNVHSSGGWEVKDQGDSRSGSWLGPSFLLMMCTILLYLHRVKRGSSDIASSSCECYSRYGGFNLKVKESEVSQSCPALCNPMDCSLPGSSIHGIFQARVLEWVTISLPPKRPTS